jgi:hypothetical protein
MQAAYEAWCEQKRSVVMNGGIAKVGGDGISTVDGMNAFEVLCYLIKGFVPSNALPTIGSAAHGMFEPVLIIVKISQRSGLRADVPAAEWVVFVTADVESLLGLNGDFDATDRFAEITGAIVYGAVVGGCHETKSYPQITQITQI